MDAVDGASSATEERLRLVARVPDGEALTRCAGDFGVSRKTGCKIFDRDKEHGQAARSDRSRRPGVSYVVLPMCPGWTVDLLAEPEGFEPSIGLYNPITV